MNKRIILFVIACMVITGAVRLVALHGPKQSQEQNAPQTYTLAVLTEQVMIKLPGDNEFHVVTGEIDIEAGAEIKTSSTGTAKLLYPNETLVTLSTDTNIRLKTLENNGAKSRIELISGGIWSRIKNILGPGEFYEIETDNTVASVRGTIFATEYRQGITSVFGIENTVRVQARDPKLKKIIEGTDADVKGGEKTSINSSALPAPARQLTRQTITANDYKRDFVRQQTLHVINKNDLANEQVHRFVRAVKEHNVTDRPFIQRMVERGLIDVPLPTPTPTPTSTPKPSYIQSPIILNSSPSESPTPTPTPSVTVSTTPASNQTLSPEIESIMPSTASVNAKITVNGRNFMANRISQIRSVHIGDMPLNFFVLDGLTIFATINSQLAPGVYDVSVKDINGRIGTLMKSLIIK